MIINESRKSLFSSSSLAKLSLKNQIANTASKKSFNMRHKSVDPRMTVNTLQYKTKFPLIGQSPILVSPKNATNFSHSFRPNMTSDLYNYMDQ
jgi:hypothetical protein